MGILVQVTSQNRSNMVTLADVRSTWRTTNGFFFSFGKLGGKKVVPSDWQALASLCWVLREAKGQRTWRRGFVRSDSDREGFSVINRKKKFEQVKFAAH
jgi:hypothetical protein